VRERERERERERDKLIQNYGWNTSKERLLSKGTFIVTTLLASFLSLYTAAVGTVWPLLGSHRNGQAVLELFQEHVYYPVHVQPDLWSTHPFIQWEKWALRE
jgi:hypothetical protein